MSKNPGNPNPYGHILHPVHKGLILSDLNLTTETLELFIADNETVEDKNEVLEDALNKGVVDIDIDDEENYIFATFKQSQQQQSQVPSQSVDPPNTPPAEVARYMSNRDAAGRPDAGIHTFDILGWWSVHEKIFPFLSKAALLSKLSLVHQKEHYLLVEPLSAAKGQSLIPQMSIILFTARKIYQRSS